MLINDLMQKLYKSSENCYNFSNQETLSSETEHLKIKRS